MAKLDLIVLCLSVLATVQLASGQGDWNQGWNQRSWGSQSWGHNRQRATRAVCTAQDDHQNQIQITIKRSHNGWFGSSLELEIEAESRHPAFQLVYDLVLTQFGADDNEGGCTVENLGNIVKRRNRWGSWMGSSSSSGVIGRVDLRNDGLFTGTFRSLPISSLQEAYGCAAALCTDTETVDDDSGSWSWGWGWGSSTERKMRCVEPITICCHLGKSEDDANAPPIRHKT